MWKLVDLGEPIEVDMGTGYLPYRVQGIEPGQVWIVAAARREGHAEKLPSYPRPRDGQRITVRYDGSESPAVVVTANGGLIEIA